MHLNYEIALFILLKQLLMLRILLLFNLSLFSLAFISIDSSGVSGFVKDKKGEPLIAYIHIYQDEALITESLTDYDGVFNIELPSGEYRLEASYIGHETQKIEVVVKEGVFSEVEIFLAESARLLEEVEIVGYELPLIAYDKSVSSPKDVNTLPSKSISVLAAKSAGVSVGKEGDITIRGSRPEATTHYVDGIRVSSESASALISKPTRSSVTSADIKSISKLAEAIESLPEAGHLTAGEWNDLKNWDTWQELLNSGEYREMVDYWSLSSMIRHSVFVTNDANIPLSNKKVELLSEDGTILWSALSDNSGSAELWLPPNIENYYIKAAGGEKVIPHKQTALTDSYHLVLSEPCLTQSSLDIMFVVDATSSMLDEINYFRAELSNVIERVKVAQQDVEAEVRLGTVFYKDSKDNYLTAVTPLDHDISKSIDFIKTKNVGGGGDTPEAVEAGLEKALEQDWNKSATSRLVFLILDAPPHHRDEVIAKLSTQIKKAAEHGIKIIPVTASGIDRQTEYLMKQMSILTNGTYVFLTDDSGVGNAHLEHIVSDYEVELFNDLLVRLITSYAKTYDCDENGSIENVPAQIKVKAFPNPTSGQIIVTTDQSVDEIIITSASGKRVLSVKQPELEAQLDLSRLIAGMYQLSVILDGQVINTQNVIRI